MTLGDPRYINLRTFRKSGAGVDTPVWCAAVGDRLFAFSAGDAGKVKRLRNGDAVQVAVCDVRGRLLGDWVDGRAHIVTSGDEIGRALAALRKKYGWQMLLADWGSRLTGRFGQRAYLCITTKEA